MSGAATWRGGGLGSARAMPPNAKLGVGGSGWGRQENQGLDLTAPHSIFPLPFQLQPWPHSFFSPQLKEQPPPRAASFLLILAPGLMDPRLGTSRAMEVGAVGVSGVSIPRINACRSAHPLLPCLLLSSLLPPCGPLPLVALRGISLFSQVLWKKEETAICDPRLNPYMNLTARELLDHFIDKETEAQGE